MKVIQPPTIVEGLIHGSQHVERCCVQDPVEPSLEDDGDIPGPAPALSGPDWTTQSKGKDHGLVKPRQTSISLVQNIILCHIRNPKRLPAANIELHPKSEPVMTQQSFAPEIVQRIHLCIIFYIYYILLI
jgi:hypothetical protein